MSITEGGEAEWSNPLIPHYNYCSSIYMLNMHEKRFDLRKVHGLGELNQSGLVDLFFCSIIRPSFCIAVRRKKGGGV